MKNMMISIHAAYMHVALLLERTGPLSLLLFRLWVALAFWRAGVVKLNDPGGTAYLFNYEYHVPLLSPDLAAQLGTGVELVFPWLLALGLMGRMSAAFLFVYNIVAVISYPDLWPHGFWVGLWGNDFIDHKAWGLMLLALTLYGPGKLSLDAVIARWLSPRIPACR
nr:DoxX family protein [Mariprofundus ferrooxydans]